jgi:hypothetical protein
VNVAIFGGVSDLHRDIERWLAPYGVTILVTYEAMRSAAVRSAVLPPGTQAVLLLYEVCGHDMSDRATMLAKAAGIPLVLISRKKSFAWPKLVAAGIVPEASNGVDNNKPPEKIVATNVLPSSKYVPPQPQLPSKVLEAVQLLVDTMRAEPVLEVPRLLLEKQPDGKYQVQYEVRAIQTGAVTL